MKKYFVLAVFVFLLPVMVLAERKNLADYVNTLQGTDSNFDLSHGNTYPTTALPFGMHTWAAQTGINGDGWKYQYQRDTIRGFQQAHQCSPWANDYNVYSLMPVTGELKVDQYGRAARFSHKNEIARPYYYSVNLDNGITAEFSPTERCAHLRFTYPTKQPSYLVLDGYVGNSYVWIDVENNRITGWVNSRSMEDYKNYFILQFDQPFLEYGTWNNVDNSISVGDITADGHGAGAYVRFKDGVKVQVKAASSMIGLEQAALNLERELGAYKTIAQTRDAACKIWNETLGRIQIEGASEDEMQTFYSCFFRANLFTRKTYEIDPNGEPYFRSPEDGRIYKGYFYNDNGFWDTFRAQFPLSNLLHPTQQGRYMEAMLHSYDIFGWLPSWTFPHEGGGMIGNHAISLFADAWAKGIRTFDPEKVLKAYFHETIEKGPRGPANGRDGWKDYYTLGYVSFPATSEATSKTLEYAYDDWCAFKLAQMTGNKFYENIFARQMYNYKNVYNPEKGFMLGRDRDGSWNYTYDEFGWHGPFTEGCAWHYLWSVFHDIDGLKELLGGDEALVAKMDSVWTVTNMYNQGWAPYVPHEMIEMTNNNMGQYAHGNQPIQHFVYMYNYTKQPWKAQKWAREVMTRLYDGTEKGFCGDEDQGQTSSWFVISALGLYSVCPGTDQYVLGYPMYPKMTVTFEDGRKLIIESENHSDENIYIQSLTLNGKEITRNYLTYDELTAGGTLKFVMGPEPNTSRGINPEDMPYSVSTHNIK